MDTLFPLASFAFISTFTPGPNNMLLLASGMRFGFFHSLPHILGIQIGIGLQLVLAVMGFSYILVEVPVLNLMLKIFGSGYLLYLAWHLRPNQLQVNSPEEARPFTFFQALLFQFINPKAWIMTMTAGSLFLPNLSSHVLATLVMCLVFNGIGASSSSSWVLAGGAIRHYLDSAFWRQTFSLTMLGLIVGTVVYLWWV